MTPKDANFERNWTQKLSFCSNHVNFFIFHVLQKYYCKPPWSCGMVRIEDTHRHTNVGDRCVTRLQQKEKEKLLACYSNALKSVILKSMMIRILEHFFLEKSSRMMYQFFGVCGGRVEALIGCSDTKMFDGF